MKLTPATITPDEHSGDLDSRYNVPNLERGLHIMELLAEHPHGLSQSDLIGRLGYSKTSVFRIMMTLLEYGYIERGDDSHNLRLSRKLLAMGTKALHERDLMGSAIDVMRSIRDQVLETVLIGTLGGGEFIVLDQVLGRHPFKFSLDAGARLPLHCAAPAKAMVAYLPERESQRLLGGIDFARFNAATITTAQRYRQELGQVRSCGYAVDRGEQLAGIHCVAAPVFDRHGYPVAAVWTTGPAERFPQTTFPRMGQILLTQVQIISGRLGYGLLEPIKAASA